MARMPDALSLGERPAPQPSASVARYDATTGLEDFGARVLDRVGHNVEELGHVAAKEYDHLTNVQAEAALNQLRDAQHDLTFGENGFINVRGGDAVNRPLVADYSRRLQDAASRIEQTLPNDQAKEKFRRRVGPVSVQFATEASTHQLRESRAFERSTFDGILASESQAIAARPRDENAFVNSLARIDAAHNVYSDRRGTSGEERQAEKGQFLDQIMQARTQAMVAQDPRYAITWWDANKAKIANPALRLQLDAVVKHQAEPLLVSDIVDSVLTPEQVTRLNAALSPQRGTAPADTENPESAGAQIPPAVQLQREQGRLRILDDELRTNPNDADVQREITSTRARIEQLSAGQPVAPRPAAARDTRAMLGEWVAAVEARAKAMRPDDPVFADRAITAVKTRFNTMVAAQEGVERQAQSYLLARARGIGADGTVGKPLTELKDVLATPEARAMYARLGDDGTLALDNALLLNSQKLAAIDSRASHRLANETYARMLLPEGDPRKISRPEQLTPLIGPEMLDMQMHEHLVAALERISSPDGRSDAQDIQNASAVARMMTTRSLIGGLQPELAEEAAYRWRQDFLQRYDQYRKDGKNWRDLITPGKPDYMLAPAVVATYVRDPRTVISAQADAERRRAADAAGAKLISTQEEAAAAPIGSKLMNQDGVLYVKEGANAYRRESPAAAAAPSAPAAASAAPAPRVPVLLDEGGDRGATRAERAKAAQERGAAARAATSQAVGAAAKAVASAAAALPGAVAKALTPDEGARAANAFRGLVKAGSFRLGSEPIIADALASGLLSDDEKATAQAMLEQIAAKKAR